MGYSMSGFVLGGDTSGAITLIAAAVAGTNTITLPAETGTVLTSASSLTSQLPTWSILQVIQGTTSTAVTYNNAGVWTDTAVTATITLASASSKVLVISNINGIYNNQASNYAYSQYRLLRGASSIAGTIGQGPGLPGVNTSIHVPSLVHVYLDSPAASGSTTYKVQINNGGNSSSGTTLQWNSTQSTMTLIEFK